MPWVTRPVRGRADVPFAAIIDDAAETYGVATEDVQVISVADGHGIHLHGADCDGPPAAGLCERVYDESDWLVLVTYRPGRRALYGVLNGVHSLWLD